MKLPMTKHYFPLILSVFCMLALSFSSCKRRDNGGTFIVTGQWLNDCTGAPHANTPLDFTLEQYGINRKSKFEHIGNGVTDAEGRFSIVCENHGSGDLYLQGDVGFPLNVLGGDGHTDDLGTFYDKYTATAVFRFVFQTAHADTMFVGSNSLPDMQVFPASGVQTVTLTKPGWGMPQLDYGGRYGFGRAHYADQPNSGDPRNLLLMNVFKVCGIGDTTQVIIP